MQLHIASQFDRYCRREFANSKVCAIVHEGKVRSLKIQFWRLCPNTTNQVTKKLIRALTIEVIACKGMAMIFSEFIRASDNETDRDEVQFFLKRVKYGEVRDAQCVSC